MNSIELMPHSGDVPLPIAETQQVVLPLNLTSNVVSNVNPILSLPEELEALKKSDSNSSLDTYIRTINKKTIKKAVQEKPKKIRIKKQTNLEEKPFPTIDNCECLLKFNYTLTELKTYASKYNLKKNGKKTELTNRIHSHLYLSKSAIKIQKVARAFLFRIYLKLFGPARSNRSLCTNTEDIVTMDAVSDIPLPQFFSYTDTNGFIYGFDFTSLYTMYCKRVSTFQNPFTREPFPKQVEKNMRRIIRFSKIYKVPLKLKYEDVSANLSELKQLEIRAVTIFQTMNTIGNHQTDAKWFLNLNRLSIISFVSGLLDVWTYRLNLSNEQKTEISPGGDPFRALRNCNIHTEPNLNVVKMAVLQVMENFVSGRNQNAKCLGTLYVLGALTTVSAPAAEALPFLFLSFS